MEFYQTLITITIAMQEDRSLHMWRGIESTINPTRLRACSVRPECNQE